MKLIAIITTLLYVSSATNVAAEDALNTNHMPKLRGAKQVMPATTTDHSHESLTSVANSYRNTAQALLKTASLAMDLATVEDLPSIKATKDQVMRAAEVAQSLGDDATDRAEEVLESIIGVQHRSSRVLSAEQMFYYSSGKAVQKTNSATQKAARKTEQATSKAERKTEQAVNKAGRKTESAIQKANYKTASAVAKAETAAASSFMDAAGALDNAAALTADAISLGTTEAANAAKLAAYEASNAMAIANDSLSYAAEVTASALNW